MLLSELFVARGLQETLNEKNNMSMDLVLSVLASFLDKYKWRLEMALLKSFHMRYSELVISIKNDLREELWSYRRRAEMLQ